MAENEGVHAPESREYFKEAVCIDALRVYDAASDKDCIEDLRVLFPPTTQAAVNTATGVRLKEAQVLNVYLDLQPIPFHRGFFSVDMTFFFDVTVELFGGPAACPTAVSGVSVFNKKVVLYGSEGSVQVFASAPCGETPADPVDSRALPRATVQVAAPVALSARLCDRPLPTCEPYCRIPEEICRRYGGPLETGAQPTQVYVTLGLFTVVQLMRNVQMLIPAYDFCLPEKESVPTSDNPCELFRQIDFPTDAFFPPRAADLGDSAPGPDRRRHPDF